MTKKMKTMNNELTLLHNKVIIDDIETAQFHLRSTNFTFYEWSILSSDYSLTTNFIDKYFDKLNPHRISTYQVLPEYLIEKYADKLDWNLLSRYQNLSSDLILKHEKKVNWKLIFRHQKVHSDLLKTA